MPRERLTAGEWLLKQALSVRAVGRLAGWATVSGILARPMGQRLSGPARLAEGLVVILPGIEGEGFLNHDIAYGLNDAGLPDAIEVFEWTRGRRRFFHNLMGLSRNRQQATLLAARLTEYRTQHPQQPVHLVAHSGGTGIAAMALEQMDPAAPITAAVLLASALSPEYNLAPALRRTAFGIYNLYSPHDFFYLGLGTTTFGTIDRKRRLAAGKIGFVAPPDLSAADAELYRTRLHQVVWRKEWLHARHAGGHLGWADRRFCREWLSRIIRNHRQGRIADVHSPNWT